MARPKKKGLERYRDGQIARAARKEDARITGMYQRLRLMANKLGDPALGSPLGQLWFYKEITDAQYDAGKKFAQLRAVYMRCKSPHRDSPKSPDLDPDAIRGAYDESGLTEAQAKLIMIYEWAVSVLRATDRRCEDIVIDICCRDQPVGNAYRRDILIMGLEALASYFRMKMPTKEERVLTKA